jgi:hypothetical protein
MVEEATLPLGLAICACRALCLGLGGRRFFMAYAPYSLTIAASRNGRSEFK